MRCDSRCAGVAPKEVHWEGPSNRRLTMTPHNYDRSAKHKYAELKIEAPQKEDAGRYTCVALGADEKPLAKRTLTLQVLERTV